MTATPMVLSPLMQAPMLAAMYAGTRLEHSGGRTHRLTHRSSRYCRHGGGEDPGDQRLRDYTQANLEENLRRSPSRRRRRALRDPRTREDRGLPGTAALPAAIRAQFGAIRASSAILRRRVHPSRPPTSPRSTARSGAMRWTSRPARRSSRRWRRRGGGAATARDSAGVDHPAAPGHAAPGAKVPVFDTITLADYICMSRTDNLRFGAAFGKEDAFHRWQGLDKAAGDAGDRHPAHRLRLRPPGAATSTELVPLPHHQDRQFLTFEKPRYGRAADRQAEGAFRAAITRLEAIPGVVGITGDCGLMNYQKEARRQAKLPCFISAVMQAGRHCHHHRLHHHRHLVSSSTSTAASGSPAPLPPSRSAASPVLVLGRRGVPRPTANGESLRPSFNKRCSRWRVTDPERQARTRPDAAASWTRPAHPHPAPTPLSATALPRAGLENVDGSTRCEGREGRRRACAGLVKRVGYAVVKNPVRAILSRARALPYAAAPAARQDAGARRDHLGRLLPLRRHRQPRVRHRLPRRRGGSEVPPGTHDARLRPARSGSYSLGTPWRRGATASPRGRAAASRLRPPLLITAAPEPGGLERRCVGAGRVE